MKHFFKYIQRNTKKLIYLYTILSIFGYFYEPSITFAFLILTFDLFLNYIIKKAMIKSYQKKTSALEHSYYKIITLVIFFSSAIFFVIFFPIQGFFLLLIMFFETYLILRKVENYTINFMNFCELLYNHIIISFLSLNYASMLIYFFIPQKIMSSFEILVAYGLPLLMIFFTLRMIGISVIYTNIKKLRQFFSQNSIKMILLSTKMAFWWFFAIIIIYVVTSSIIYMSFVSKYNSALDKEKLIPDKLKARMNENFVFAVNYQNNVKFVNCSGLKFEFKKVFNDEYLEDIFCTYAKVTTLLIENKSIFKSSEQNIDDYKFWSKLIQSSKPYYIIKSYKSLFS